MADLISQDDLNALWGSLSGDEFKGPPAEKEEKPAQSAGISQADLDALWGGLDCGGDGQSPLKPEANDSRKGGLSQADLDALWGLTPGAQDPAPAAPKEESSAPKSESLSQDDIDKLLAEMGR
jgi:hypothetical protein